MASHGWGWGYRRPSVIYHHQPSVVYLQSLLHRNIVGSDFCGGVGGTCNTLGTCYTKAYCNASFVCCGSKALRRLHYSRHQGGYHGGYHGGHHGWK